MCAKIATFEYLFSTHVSKLNVNEYKVLEMAIYQSFKKAVPEVLSPYDSFASF